MAAVGHQVEGLRLNAGGIHGRPFQIGLGQLSVRCRLSLSRNGLNGGWAIDWLLCTGDIRDSKILPSLPELCI